MLGEGVTVHRNIVKKDYSIGLWTTYPNAQRVSLSTTNN
jgi:hypothetical protein